MFFRSIDPFLSHIAVLGNALPRQCGIATYTTHSVEALRQAYPDLRFDHYAMDDGHNAEYGSDVFHTILSDSLNAYEEGADKIRASGAQLLWIHHEFGIFGGSAGDHLLELLRRLDIPLAVTLHTVLANATDDQRRVMNALIRKSERLIVMAHQAARVLGHELISARFAMSAFKRARERYERLKWGGKRTRSVRGIGSSNKYLCRRP